MKVLFISLPEIGLIGGGLPKQINLTADALEKIGVNVIYYNPWNNDIDSVDLCHFFGLTSCYYSIFTKAITRNKPVVISPVFNFNSEGITWRQRKIMACLSNIRGLFTSYRLIKKMLMQADRVFPLNEEELEKLERVFNICTDHFVIMPIGMNKKFMRRDTSLFLKKYAVSNFVLNVATLSPTKNQLTLIKAMSGLPYTLVLIGPEPAEQQDYIKKCRATAGKNVIFAGLVDEDMLVSAYAAARLFVLPSFSEVMPACLYEAAMAGCKKIITAKDVPVPREMKPHIRSAEPSDVNGFREIIKDAMESSDDSVLCDIVSSMPDWDDIAQQILKTYEEVLIKKI